MTEIKKDDAETSGKTKARIKRRSVLKAGAVIAPLAITLHGGIPLAHAASAACDVKMAGQQIIPEFTSKQKQNGEYKNEPTGRMLGYQGTRGKTGRVFNSPHRGYEETHWDYIKQTDVAGHSCYNSITIAGGKPTL